MSRRLGVGRVPEQQQNGNDGAAVDVQGAADVEGLIAKYEGSDYIEAVVELAEQSERNYRAAVMAGQVINGRTDSTNY
jgi:6,7-dimethyl-8-ribityllumazine synthase